MEKQGHEQYDSPELAQYGTVADLTEGGGDDNPEQSGSTFPVSNSDRRLKSDIRPL
jgi:hypothetical protein